MKSHIDLRDSTPNMLRRFGSATFYHSAIVVRSDGRRVAALFTPKQIEEAVSRAAMNPEDCPDTRTFWQRLFRK